MKFFESTKQPGLWMNRAGAVFAPNGHPAGENYYSMSFENVPVYGQARRDIVDEAFAAGYGIKVERGEVVYTKPEAAKC